MKFLPHGNIHGWPIRYWAREYPTELAAQEAFDHAVSLAFADDEKDIGIVRLARTWEGGKAMSFEEAMEAPRTVLVTYGMDATESHLPTGGQPIELPEDTIKVLVARRRELYESQTPSFIRRGGR